MEGICFSDVADYELFSIDDPVSHKKSKLRISYVNKTFKRNPHALQTHVYITNEILFCQRLVLHWKYGEQKKPMLNLEIRSPVYVNLFERVSKPFARSCWPFGTLHNTGKNNGFPFLDTLGYLKNTHKNPKFDKVRQVPTWEFPTKFPDWDLSHSSKFGIFFGILKCRLFLLV